MAILLISSQFVFAQAPGFMGKRASIYYNYSSSPSLDGHAIPYNYSKKNVKGIVNYIRGYHQATFEYALSRRLSVNAHYFRHRGGYGGIDEYELAPNQDPNKSRNYKSQALGISLKRYRIRYRGYGPDDGAIAPIGRYIEPKVFVSFVKDEERQTSDNSVLSSNRKMYYGGSIKFGRHLLITNKIILDFGMEFGYTLTPEEYQELYSQYTDVVVSGIALNSYSEVARHHFVGFHVGIGYPLF